MFCSKCGRQLPEGAKFCTCCGQVLARKVTPAAHGRPYLTMKAQALGTDQNFQNAAGHSAAEGQRYAGGYAPGYARQSQGQAQNLQPQDDTWQSPQGGLYDNGVYGQASPDKYYREGRAGYLTAADIWPEGLKQDIWPESSENPKRNICSGCGHEIRSEWRLCPFCGNALVGFPEDSRTRKALAVIVLCLQAFSFFCFFMPFIKVSSFASVSGFEIISETTGYSGEFAAAGLCLIIAALCAIAGAIAGAVSIVSRSFAGNIACSVIGVFCVIVSFFLLSGSLEGLLEGAVSLDSLLEAFGLGSVFGRGLGFIFYMILMIASLGLSVLGAVINGKAEEEAFQRNRRRLNAQW